MKKKKQVIMATAMMVGMTSTIANSTNVLANTENEDIQVMQNTIDNVIDEVEQIKEGQEEIIVTAEKDISIEKAVGDVEINETSFPDETFREYIKVNFDLNHDGILSSDEISQAKRIDVSDDYRIKSLEGIQYFINLDTLFCKKTGITSLDVSKNTKLKKLDCSYTGIISLDVSNNVKLEYLDCYKTDITELVVNNNKELITLYCHGTGITELDISENTALKTLFCFETDITELVVNNNKELTALYCSQTKITNLDVSDNPALEDLQCRKTGITSLDVSNNPELTRLNCEDTGITSLDVSNNSALVSLYCGDTGITNLDVSNNPSLKWLHCSKTDITSLDVSKNFKLTYLDCSNTGITTLDVSNNPALESLSCLNMQIIGLSVSNNPRLDSLNIRDTNLAWLHVGNNADLYVNKSNSTIDLGKINEAFNIADLFPGIDLSKITVTNGATLDTNTGMVSGYVNGTPIKYSYDCGTGNNGTITLNVTLKFQTDSQIGQSSIAINGNLDKVYDGKAVVDPQVIVTGSTGAVTYEWYTADGTKLQTAPVDVGSYKIKAILAGDGKFDGVEVEKEFKITKATNQWTQELTIQDWVYGEAKKPSASGQFGKVEYTYSTTEDGVYTNVVPREAGTYWVKAVVVGTNNYEGLESKKSFTIEKASSNITINNDLNKVYDGIAVANPQVTVTGSTGTVSFEWYKKEENTTKAITWTKLTIAPIEIGEYKVVVTVAEDQNHTEAAIEQEFSILEHKVEVPGVTGVVTNPDGDSITVTPNDTIESNGLTTMYPDGSIVFPNGGSITRPDGITEVIQPGGVLKPNQVEEVPTPGEGGVTTNPGDMLGTGGTETNPEGTMEGIPSQGVIGVQTGDSTQMRLWTVLAGLSTGLMMYFRKKNRKEEV